MKLGKPVAIVEGNAVSPLQPERMLTMTKESTPTPIEGGELQVTVQVTVTWAIDPS